MKTIKHYTDSEFNAAFPNDSRCERYLLLSRANGNYKCPKCNCWLYDYVPHYKRKYWRCKNCQHKIYPAALTLFENNHRGLKVCFDIVKAVLQKHGGISIADIRKSKGGSPDSLRVFVEKIYAQCIVATDFYFDNPNFAVQSDESYLKTSPKGLSRHHPFQSGRGSEWNSSYQMVKEQMTGRTKAFLIPGVDSDTLDRVTEQCVSKDVNLYTDRFGGYDNLKNLGYKNHQRITHKREWVRGEVNTQGVENAHSHFKRSLRTHMSISERKANGYLALSSFQQTYRNEPDYGFEMFIKSLPPLIR